MSISDLLFGEEGESGSTYSDIGRARDMFRAYMDWASRGLFDVADASTENRKKSANKLFDLNDIGTSLQADALNRGYNNAQNRQALTTLAARNARLGLPEDMRYLSAQQMPIDVNMLSQVGLPDIALEMAKPNPAGYGIDPTIQSHTQG